MKLDPSKLTEEELKRLFASAAVTAPRLVAELVEACRVRTGAKIAKELAQAVLTEDYDYNRAHRLAEEYLEAEE